MLNFCLYYYDDFFPFHSFNSFVLVCCLYVLYNASMMLQLLVYLFVWVFVVTFMTTIKSLSLSLVNCSFCFFQILFLHSRIENKLNFFVKQKKKCLCCQGVVSLISMNSFLKMNSGKEAIKIRITEPEL